MLTLDNLGISLRNLPLAQLKTLDISKLPTYVLQALFPEPAIYNSAAYNRWKQQRQRFSVISPESVQSMLYRERYPIPNYLFTLISTDQLAGIELSRLKKGMISRLLSYSFDRERQFNCLDLQAALETGLLEDLPAICKLIPTSKIALLKLHRLSKETVEILFLSDAQKFASLLHAFKFFDADDICIAIVRNLFNDIFPYNVPSASAYACKLSYEQQEKLKQLPADQLKGFDLSKTSFINYIFPASPKITPEEMIQQKERFAVFDRKDVQNAIYLNLPSHLYPLISDEQLEGIELCQFFKRFNFFKPPISLLFQLNYSNDTELIAAQKRFSRCSPSDVQWAFEQESLLEHHLVLLSDIQIQGLDFSALPFSLVWFFAHLHKELMSKLSEKQSQDIHVRLHSDEMAEMLVEVHNYQDVLKTVPSQDLEGLDLQDLPCIFLQDLDISKLPPLNLAEVFPNPAPPNLSNLDGPKQSLLVQKRRFSVIPSAAVQAYLEQGNHPFVGFLSQLFSNAQWHDLRLHRLSKEMINSIFPSDNIAAADPSLMEYKRQFACFSNSEVYLALERSLLNDKHLLLLSDAHWQELNVINLPRSLIFAFYYNETLKEKLTSQQKADLVHCFQTALVTFDQFTPDEVQIMLEIEGMNLDSSIIARFSPLQVKQLNLLKLPKKVITKVATNLRVAKFSDVLQDTLDAALASDLIDRSLFKLFRPSKLSTLTRETMCLFFPSPWPAEKMYQFSDIKLIDSFSPGKEELFCKISAEEIQYALDRQLLNEYHLLMLFVERKDCLAKWDFADLPLPMIKFIYYIIFSSNFYLSSLKQYLPDWQLHYLQRKVSGTYVPTTAQQKHAATLGVEVGATRGEITAARRKLLLSLRPDKAQQPDESDSAYAERRSKIASVLDACEALLPPRT